MLRPLRSSQELVAENCSYSCDPRRWGREGQLPYCLWPRVTLLSSRKPMPPTVQELQNPGCPTKRSSEFGDRKLNVCLATPGPEDCSRPLLGSLQQEAAHQRMLLPLVSPK